MATIRAVPKAEVAPMMVAQISKPGGDFEIVKRAIPEPDAGEVRIKVQACGVCHSDLLTKDGLWPGIQYPRVPGHEVAGVIDAVGAGVSEWKKGQRAGVGWHGGHDGTCRECRRGDFRNCQNVKVCGISYDGGYQQYMVAPAEAVVAIPDSLNDADAAPLLCAGITTYNALRHSGALPGDLVAVQGVGGLGGTSAFNSRTSLATTPWRSGAVPKTLRWQRNSEPASISTVNRRKQPKPCKNSEARE